MKKMLTTATLVGFTSLTLLADEANQPYIIQRDDEVIEILEMPTFTVSEPISNSFLYINGEYIEPPYIVSVSNLAVLINGIIVQDNERSVHSWEWWENRGGRIGLTPDRVRESVDSSAESFVRGLQSGIVQHLANGGRLSSARLYGGDGGALSIIERARKALKGDEQAKKQFAREMGLETRMSVVHPDWIERLATNTNLEARATAILEAKGKTQ